MKTKQTKAKLPKFDCDTFYSITDERAVSIARSYMIEALEASIVVASQRMGFNSPTHAAFLEEYKHLLKGLLEEDIDSSLIRQLRELASQTQRYLELLEVVVSIEELKRLN